MNGKGCSIALLLSMLAICFPNSVFCASERGAYQICADVSSPTIAFAVSEFQTLAKAISGRRGAALDDPPAVALSGRDVVLIVGDKPPKLFQEMDNAGISHPDKAPDNPDGFLIQTSIYKGHNILIIASKSDIGALYGVYDYFERYCGAGYFIDGDFLPKGPLAFSDISYSFAPVFKYRGTSCWTGHRGLSKHFSNSWDMPRWERFLKWMAKWKLNLFAGYEIGSENQGGDIDRLAFPDIYKQPETGPPTGARTEDRGVEWVFTWIRDPVAQRKLTQKVFGYGRMLGIKFANSYDYGKVYPDYVKAHPEYKYLSSALAPGQDYYNMGKWWDALMPGSPECRDYTYTHWKTIHNTLGSDSLWRIGWFTEIYSVQGKNIVDLKLQAAREQADIIKKIDPAGNILIDTWGMAGWKKEDLTRFWEGLPKDVGVIIFQSGIPEIPLDEENSYGGHKRIFNYLHSLAGHVSIHGEPYLPITHIKKCLSNPASRGNLLGYVHGSEAIDHPYLVQLDAHLAWDPEGFDQEAFVRDYARRRFGKQSFDNMYKSVKALAEGMNYYEGFGSEYGRHGRLIEKILPARMKDENIDVGRCACAAHAWENALYYALKEAKAQAKNPLYRNYVTDLTLDFLESKLALELINLSQVYRFRISMHNPDMVAPTVVSIKTHLDRIDGIYRDILALLSTDPAYCLKDDIDRLMSQDGTNPFTPVQFQRWAVSSYCSMPAVECYRDYYYPLFKIYAEEVISGAEADKKPAECFISSEFKQRAYELWKSFWSEPLKPVSDKAASASSIDLALSIYGKYSCMNRPISSAAASE